MLWAWFDLFFGQVLSCNTFFIGVSQQIVLAFEPFSIPAISSPQFEPTIVELILIFKFLLFVAVIESKKFGSWLNHQLPIKQRCVQCACNKIILFQLETRLLVEWPSSVGMSTTLPPRAVTISAPITVCFVYSSPFTMKSGFSVAISSKGVS